MIVALLEKDIKLFFRNQFNAVITALSIVLFIAAYLLLPDDVDESMELALFVEDDVPAEMMQIFGDAIDIEAFDSQDDLVNAVEDGEYPVGLVLTNDAAAALNDNQQGTLPVYYAPGTTSETRSMYDNVLSITLNALQFQQNPPVLINQTTEMRGPENLDEPVSLRDRMLPGMLLVIYATEMMGLAGLIVEEVESKTARGILTTPLRLSQFFTAKAIMGVGLALVQAVLLLLAAGMLLEAPLILTLTLLLMGLFICGMAFIVAAMSQNYTTVIGWSVLFILILIIPTISLVAPGLSSDFMNLIPSYFFIDTLDGVINLDAGWGDVSTSLLALFLTSSALLGAGSLLLRRKLA